MPRKLKQLLKNNDKVFVGIEQGNTFVAELDEIQSVGGQGIKLKKKNDDFNDDGEHGNGPSKLKIIPIEPSYLSSFAKSAHLKDLSKIQKITFNSMGLDFLKQRLKKRLDKDAD